MSIHDETWDRPICPYCKKIIKYGKFDEHVECDSKLREQYEKEYLAKAKKPFYDKEIVPKTEEQFTVFAKTSAGYVPLPFAKKLEHKVDKLEAELTEAMDMISKLLYVMPTGSCDMFHHTKKDRHEYDESCKPLERYNQIIEQAERKYNDWRTTRQKT